MTTAQMDDRGDGAAHAATGRDTSIDLARGLAMILVVLGHALIGVMGSGGEGALGRWLVIVIYTTHMALFFELSGLLSGGTRKRPWPAFGRQMATRILWPYLLWSFIILATHYMMSAYTNTEVTSFQPWTILWKPPAVMWFLYVLCVAMVVLRVLAPLPEAVTLGVGLALFALAYAWPGLSGNARFVGLFLISAMVGRAVLPVLVSPAGQVVSALVMAVTFWLAWHEAQAPLDGYPAFRPEYIPALIAGPALMLGLCRWLSQARGVSVLRRALTHIGQKTMAIFVTHILITAGSRIALRILGVTDGLTVTVIATVLGVGLPLIAVALTDRFKLSAWLGWR